MIDLELIKNILSKEPAYRLKQVYQVIFKDLSDSWQKTTILPDKLKSILSQKCPLLVNADKTISEKDTIKARIILDDGLKVETVLMRHDKRNTVCVSSQIGCPLGCKFCATGSVGFKRNLTDSEIVGQIVFFARILKKGNEKIDNIVFMGMGEPFLNYDNVIKAIRIINDKNGLNIGARHISISTIGIPEKIRQLGQENLQINLAISLHSPNDAIRSSLMPFNDKIPIKKVLEAVDDYIKITKRQVMFGYLLIDGINDSKECAQELSFLMRNSLYFVNLILYNPTDNKLKPSKRFQVDSFKKVLKRNKIKFSERYRFGQNIDAACGQLAGK